MSGAHCEKFPTCMKVSDQPKAPKCEKDDCPGNETWAPFFHAMPKADACDHDFQGWREFEDGRGGERVCTKCGMGAMTYSMRYGG